MKDVPLKVNSVDTLDASDWNDVYGDLRNFLLAYDLTLSGVDLDQTGEAMTMASALAASYSVAGTSNAILLSPGLGRLAPGQYYDGMMVHFVAALDTVAGAVTVNVGGLGAVTVVPEGFFSSDMPGAGLLLAGFRVALQYHAGTARFIFKPGDRNGLLSASGPSSVLAASSVVIPLPVLFSGYPTRPIVATVTETDGSNIQDKTQLQVLAVSATSLTVGNVAAFGIAFDWVVVGSGDVP